MYSEFPKLHCLLNRCPQATVRSRLLCISVFRSAIVCRLNLFDFSLFAFNDIFYLAHFFLNFISFHDMI